MAKAKNSAAGGEGGTATAAPRKKKAPARQRTMIEHAEWSLRRQIDALGPEATVTVKDGLEGVIRLLQTVDQIVDTSSPPAAGSPWDKVVGLGRSRRLVGQVFAPKPAAAAEGGTNGAAAAPVGAAAAGQGAMF